MNMLGLDSGLRKKRGGGWRVEADTRMKRTVVEVSHTSQLHVCSA